MHTNLHCRTIGTTVAHIFVLDRKTKMYYSISQRNHYVIDIIDHVSLCPEDCIPDGRAVMTEHELGQADYSVNVLSF